MHYFLREKALKIDDSLLQHLPASVCRVFAAASDLPLDDPAALADRVLEVAIPTKAALQGDVRENDTCAAAAPVNSTTELQSLRQRIAQALEEGDLTLLHATVHRLVYLTMHRSAGTITGLVMKH
ncbi:hypothetical protein MRX96_050150 [Rhipicephalus microplus]